MLAGLDDLDRARASPIRRGRWCAGNSWGGYITLLSLGLHPDRCALGLAGVPVADYPAAYEDEARGAARVRPDAVRRRVEDIPDLYVERSPMTYIDNVRAPVADPGRRQRPAVSRSGRSSTTAIG